MLKKDQNPPAEIPYARDFPVLSRVLIVLDKLLCDFSRNCYRKISLPFYTVDKSDYENLRIYHAVNDYFLHGKSRLNYKVLDLLVVRKNRKCRPSITDFDLYLAFDRFYCRWPENIREITKNLRGLGELHSFNLQPENPCLYRLVLGGRCGDPDGRSPVPMRRPFRLTSDDL
jgi:hypothetical protein